MTVLNRIVVILLLLALIVVFTVGLIVPREAIRLLQDGLDQLDGQLDTSVSTAQLVIRVALALVINGVLLILLYLQVRRQPDFGVPVQQVKEGEAQIAVDSIVDRLVYHLDPLPGVLDVKPTITPRRRGVEVALDVEMAVNVDMPANIDEISTVTRQVIEEELGLKLKGKPKLKLRTVLFPEPVRSVEVQRPAPAETRDDEGAVEPVVTEAGATILPDNGDATEI